MHSGMSMEGGILFPLTAHTINPITAPIPAGTRANPIHSPNWTLTSELDGLTLLAKLPTTKQAPVANVQLTFSFPANLFWNQDISFSLLPKNISSGNVLGLIGRYI